MTTDSFFALAVAAMIMLFFGFILAFAGYRFMAILLPIFGFFFGFVLGAQLIQAWFGDGFLSTVSSWAVGLLFAVSFAAASYLFYFLAVSFVAVALGFALGAGLMQAIGFDFGFLVWLVGVVAGLALAVAVLTLNVQKYAVIGATALLGAGVAVGTFAIARAVLRYAERYLTHRATLRILAGLRVWFFAAVEPLAPAGLWAHRSGDLLARIGADVETLDAFFVRGVAPPLTAALVAALAALLLGRFDPALGLTALAFLVLAGVFLPLATRRLARAPARRLIATRATLHAGLADDFQGLAELLAFGQEDGLRARVGALSAGLEGAEGRLARVRGAGVALGALLAGLAGVAVLWLAIPLVAAGRIEGVFLALLPLTAMAAFEGVLPLSGAMQQREASYAAAGRLFEVIDAPPAVRDPAQPLAPPETYGVEVRQVRFRYAPDEALVLDGLDFAVPAGGRLAIVGPSGAGKSTIVNLLLRFWEPERGQVRIGGRDLSACRAEDIRRLLVQVQATCSAVRVARRWGSWGQA